MRQALGRGRKALQHGVGWYSLLSIALDNLTIGRALHGLRLTNEVHVKVQSNKVEVGVVRMHFDEADDKFRASGQNDFLPHGLLARARFRRNLGNWEGTVRDLDEVEEIAEPGPMRLFLCDMALERSRLSFARIEAFAPLAGLIENGLPKPTAPDVTKTALLKQEASKNLGDARKLIAECGYHRRDEELAELEAVLRGEKKFADLPPRV